MSNMLLQACQNEQNRIRDFLTRLKVNTSVVAGGPGARQRLKGAPSCSEATGSSLQDKLSENTHTHTVWAAPALR